MTEAVPWLSVRRGDAPLVLSLPHGGTVIPPGIEAQLGDVARARQDTDWWIADLYAFAARQGATIVATSISRSVIDVNRDPSGQSLYPGRATTELCPTTTFDGLPLYGNGRLPSASEIEARRQRFHAPYHEALAHELARLRARHERVVLYDAHSIRSVVPRLFEGELPALNLGSHAGRSCDPALAARLCSLCAASPFSWVIDGRFQGGYITRHYGQPQLGVHAVQMELAMRTYLEEPPAPADPAAWPPAFDLSRAAPLIRLLESLLAACLDFTARPPRTPA